jgi:hypothetical protein
MSEYVAKYTFFIDNRKRPENFPNEVYIIDHYPHVESDRAMAELFNTRFTNLASGTGVVVYLEQDIDARTVNFNSRVFVPWHMITHSSGEVKLVIPQEPKPKLDDMIPAPDSTDEKPKVMIQ